MRAVPGFTLETAREVEPNPSRMELRFASGNEMLGAEVDWSGDDDNLLALGLGVPPLPLWAHGEPAAMPALLFFAPRKPHAPNGALDAWSDMGGIGGIATLPRASGPHARCTGDGMIP